ncbi:MAG: sugar transferase [Lachnospiraceae bacterium]|nr:sugar transferase [Lachnospiraceae bacterium]
MYRKTPKGWLKHWDFILWELLTLQVSFVIAYYIRQGFNGLHVYQSDLYRILAVILLLDDICVVYFAETFKDVLRRGIYREFVKTVKHTALVVLIAVFYLFVAQKSVETSRTIILFTGAIHVILSFLIRIAYKAALKSAMKKRGMKSLLIISSASAAEDNIDAVIKNNFDFYRIAGIILVDDDSKVGKEIKGVKVVASFEDAPDYIGREWVDEVFLSVNLNRENVLVVYKKIAESGVTTHLSLKGFEAFDNRPHIIEKVAGQMVLTSTIHYTTTRQAFIKRTVDIFGGIVGSIFTVVLTIFLGPIIFIASPGPIFFLQERIGLNGKKFKIVKFRTMYPDAEARKQALMDQNNIKDGMMFKMDFDPRIIGNKILPDGTKKTGIGQWLRNHSIDEFPQFFNVLAGQMSLVGTRPPTPDEWDKYKLHHRARLAIKPGITGLWQVSGRSDIQDFEEVVKLDTEYITEWTMGRDFRIIFKTIGVVFSAKGAK